MGGHSDSDSGGLSALSLDVAWYCALYVNIYIYICAAAASVRVVHGTVAL